MSVTIFNIVTSCDDTFAQHACVMLTSLLYRHQSESHLFKIYLLVPTSFSQENKKKIVQSLSRWTAKLEFVPVDEGKLSELKVDRHITSAAYFRLYLPELLPSEVKALYLDSDIIINDSILELINTDISNYAMAAVPDAWVDQDEEIKSKIFLKEKAHYFNSGVLLLDLERWRAEKIGPRALKFCKSNPDRITWHDQCAINHIIQGRFYVLDKKWNFQVEHMTRTSEYKFHPDAQREASSAAIIHFTSSSKPWHFTCTHPKKDLYFKYLEYTKWRGSKEIGRTPRNVIKKYLGIYLPSTARRVETAYMFGKNLFGALLHKVLS